MQIIQHRHPESGPEPGLQRLRMAGPPLGIAGFECWLLNLAPHASCEGSKESGEHVLLVLQGLGKLLLAGAPQRFAAPCTLVLPPFTDYKLVNQGTEPLQMLAISSPAPAARSSTSESKKP